MRLGLYLVVLAAVWPLGGGWKTYHMTNDPSVPAAMGDLAMKNDKANGNVHFKLKVEHLPNPARLTPSASVYVVWVMPRDGQPQKEGLIGVNKGLTGNIDGTTTVRDGDVFITSENGDAVTAPSGTQVLHTHFSL